MVDLWSGMDVTTENPTLEVATSMPGMINDIWVKEGPTGPAGRNITSVIRTSGDGSPGSTDVYTITFSDATTATFSIVNGANGSLTGTAGGDLSGTYPNPTVKTTVITAVAATNTLGGSEKIAPLSALTGTSTADCAAASWLYSNGNLTGNITLAMSNPPPTGTVGTFTVEISQGATPRTVTMPSGSIWLGTAPTQAANKKCVITMATRDGGTTWICSGGVQA